MIRKSAIAIVAIIWQAGNALPAEITLANWNIQTLVYLGDPQTVFDDDYVRSAADIADLKRWRDLVAADVYFLQEVTSPAAIDAVFPVAEGWVHCISGQYSQSQGLAAGPTCTSGNDAPHRPSGEERMQFTAIAVHSSGAARIVKAEDFEALNVRSMDDGEVRDVRWGLDVTLEIGGKQVRTLVVHMKSGCFDDRIDRAFWLNDPAGTPPKVFACDTLGRQLFPLRKWIEEREAGGDSWLVAGDFNRRLDAGAGPFQDEVWRALSGFTPDRAGIDQDSRPDIELFRSPYKEASVCWREFLDARPADLAAADNYNLLPIEFFLFGTTADALVVKGNDKQVAWPHPVAADPKRLSDHCPSSIRLATGGN